MLLFVFPTLLRDFVTKNGSRKRKKLKVYTVETIFILLLSIIVKGFLSKRVHKYKALQVAAHKNNQIEQTLIANSFSVK